VAHAVTPDLGTRYFNTALIADDALVAYALVLSTIALPVLLGTKNALTEQSIALGLQGSIVNGLGLRYFAVRPP
jgi:hypothetical protein